MNINKVRRVVRARNGSQILKFQTPSGPLQLKQLISKDYGNLKFFNQNLDLNWQLLQGNPYISSNGLATPVSFQSPSFSPEAQQIAQQSMQRLQDQNQNNIEQKQQIVSSSINPQETAERLSQGKSATNLLSLSNPVSLALDTADSLFFGKQKANDSALTSGIRQGYNLVSNYAMKVNPIFGLGLKGAGLVSDTLSSFGLNNDQQTGFDKAISGIPILGNLLSIGGKRTQQFSVNNNTIEQVGGSYTGSVQDINNAAEKANKKFTIFSNRARKKANQQIDQARNYQNTMTDIANRATDLQSIASNMSDLNHLAYAFNMNGGYDQRYLRAAKQGTKIARIKKLQLHKIGGIVKQSINIDTKKVENISPLITISEPVEVLETGGTVEWNPVITEVVEEFKNGGKTEDSDKIEETSQKNLIPEGALHAGLHHMDNAENLTKKGIPVVDNDGEQQAEIERNEIIFTLEVTKKLEELYSKYEDNDSSAKEKDDAAIEAGKLLVEQILFNTDDRTSLIKTLKQGGIIDGDK